ncbi:DNA repair protein REV1-like [Actinia tenebrosa]|uniref:DNA repair protein REV1 n=1 Tax=Actinia tenebrosa TaxID=6105 RepID=A0A6P8IM23_ACTTE|nr:DNA repair protein REV1-like [Actinia tenebrosa]
MDLGEKTIKAQDKRNKRKKDWGHYGEYMSAKLRKLDEQFTADVHSAATESRESSAIFQGLAIFINGYTIPPADDLRKLFVLHGGRFQQYFSRSSVTHIIATNLPNSKITEIRDKKIVRPQWILDSIEQGRCLPIDQYLLYSGRLALQKRLNFSNADQSVQSTVQHPSSKEKKNTVCCIDSEIPTINVDTLNAEKPSNTENKQKFDSDAPLDMSVDFANSSILMDLPMANDDKGDDDASTKAKRHVDNTGIPVMDKEINTRHLKAGEPNFMTEFYSNSRLHHLSTWSAEFKQFTSDLIKARIRKGIVPHQNPGPASYGRVIMHVDMDCFFVSVGLRNKPSLLGKPVAVCHAGKTNTGKEVISPGKEMSASFFTSMSEIASCSYEARKAGVRNGMFLGAARRLCPDIICIPYNFQDYRDVSKKMFETLVQYSHDIEAVSCDEAYLDVTHSLDDQTTPLALAQKMRNEIKGKTGCNVSVGIGNNVLLARMCTRIAKPNGQFYLSAEDDVLEFVGSQKVTDLPGIGRAQGHKLKSLGIDSCADLQKCSLQFLQQTFGEKTGFTLYGFCRGEDDRPIRVERERKSVSAEINYGMRFTKESEAEHFIDELSREVQKRLKECGVKGRSITLKLKVRRQGAQEPLKFMGHGICDNIARSAGLQVPTDDSRLIFKKCQSLFRQLRVSSSDVRGLGIQVSKLTHSGGAARTLHDYAQTITSTDNNRFECQSREKENENKIVTSLKHDEDSGLLSGILNSSSESPPNSFCYVKERHGDCSSPTRRESIINYEALEMDSQIFPPLPRFTPQPRSTSSAKREVESVQTFDEDLCLPSFSQLDVSALNALPKDMRLKIEKHYSKDKEKTAKEPVVTEDNRSLQKSPQTSESSPPRLGGEVTLSGVKSVIKEWASTEAPIKEDVEVVSSYLLDLIMKKNMELLHLLIKFLIRCIKKTENSDWQSACEDIVDRVQMCFIQHYGAPLVL